MNPRAESKEPGSSVLWAPFPQHLTRPTGLEFQLASGSRLETAWHRPNFWEEGWPPSLWLESAVLAWWLWKVQVVQTRSFPQCSTAAVPDRGQTASLSGTLIHPSSLGKASLWEFQQLQPGLYEQNSDDGACGDGQPLSLWFSQQLFQPAGSGESGQSGQRGLPREHHTCSAKGQSDIFCKWDPDPIPPN